MNIFNRWRISRLQPATGNVGYSNTPVTATWFDVFLALLGVAGDTVDLGVDYARTAFQKLVTALVIFIGLIAWGFVLNYNEYYYANIILASFFAIVTAILWWRPGQVAWVGVAGAIIGSLDQHDLKHGGLSGGAKWLINEYLNIFKIVALVGTVSLFYLGFIPFGTNPGAFFVLVGGGIAASLLSDRYAEQLKGTFAVELAFYGICFIITLAIFSLIPDSSWSADPHKPFMAKFMLALIGNIKNGLFLFGLLLSVTIVLMVRRKKADAKDKEGWPWLIITLFGIMDGIFMPWGVAMEYLPWGGGHHAPQMTSSQPAIVPAVYQTGTLPPQKLQVVPGEGFKKVDIPPGRVLKDLTWNCPDGCILEIVHGGQPLCPTTGIYQGLPCGSLSPEVGNSGATVYREQFSVPYGVFINFPRDLVVVGVAFGTDAVLGPIEVTSTITL